MILYVDGSVRSIHISFSFPYLPPPPPPSLQLYSSEFSHHLTELERRVSSSSAEALGTSFSVLRQQLEHWQHLEGFIGGLGRLLETMVTSQKKLMDIGTQVCVCVCVCVCDHSHSSSSSFSSFSPFFFTQVSQDVVQLVRRNHKQWSDLRKTISSRINDIKTLLSKPDPENSKIGQ